MTEFLKHTIKDNLKKGARILGGTPVGAAIEYFASASPLSNYTQKDLDYAKQMTSIKNVKPLDIPRTRKPKNKKGAR
tara:strand:- start:47 stop:277 length:231 start_codon:yes stop_codon:yes gene_type:complete